MDKIKYEDQLFGFNPEQFVNAVKCAVKEEVVTILESMVNGLVAKSTETDGSKVEQVKQITKKLLDKYVCASEEPLKTLQSQLEELMKIPAHCLLPSDEAQRKQYTAEDERETDAQINDLLQRLKRTQAFSVELQQEMKMLKEYLPRLQQQVIHCNTSDTDEMEEVLARLEPAVDRLNDEINMLKVCNKTLL